MKQTLLITTALMLVVGCSESDAQQKVITVTETYGNAVPKIIKTYKESNDKFELVKSISLDENGQKEYEGTYKDGELDGKTTSWHYNGQMYYENGQKWLERTYKDGELDGKSTWYYENGQKQQEGTYKNGELIKEIRWDEDGNER